MRNRKVQRELRRSHEEKLDPKNYVGISDPTPFQAVQNMRKQQIAEAKARILAREAKGEVA
jgi:hypothetical protein